MQAERRKRLTTASERRARPRQTGRQTELIHISIERSIDRFFSFSFLFAEKGEGKGREGKEKVGRVAGLIDAFEKRTRRVEVNERNDPGGKKKNRESAGAALEDDLKNPSPMRPSTPRTSRHRWKKKEESLRFVFLVFLLSSFKGRPPREGVAFMYACRLSFFLFVCEGGAYVQGC
mmetsp:Transcript_25428/g.49688  ORF Transcript_25428/g.49688 Transcript_25428/m.49688 type:complete len:176 (+) Transcript_25428:1378-1905(+)